MQTFSKHTLGVLGPHITDQIQALNRDFLHLLVDRHLARGVGEEASDSLVLPTSVAAQLIELPTTALDAIAACRFTLFSLSFDASDTWQRLGSATLADESVQRRYGWHSALGGNSSTAAVSGLLSVALAFAWHLHRLDHRLARVVLALRDDSAKAFSAMPLWRLQQIAFEHPNLLAARWPHNACFWPDLVRFAREGSAELDGVRLVGTQLISQELEPRSIELLTRLRPTARARKAVRTES